MSKIEQALEKLREKQLQSSQRQTEIGLISPADKSDEISKMGIDYRYMPEQMDQLKLIHQGMADKHLLDAFRHLRTMLLRKEARRNFVVMVTGVTKGSGTSFTAQNLAAVLAFEEGKTALLVDCNFANASLDRLLPNIPHPIGLTDYLVDSSQDTANIIHATGMPRLRLITAGQSRHASMEFFTAPRMFKLFGELKNRYAERYIVIDAPAMSNAADARILAQLCDYVLLVIPYGQVTKEQVALAAHGIPEGKLIGAVFNNDPVLPFL
jgi:Mrp family chromosome partitioning ATPase